MVSLTWCLLVQVLFDSFKMKQCTEVRFANFLSVGFITAILVNLPERKLAKHTSVQWVAGSALKTLYFFKVMKK